jgi:hypothetical protein
MLTKLASFIKDSTVNVLQRQTSSTVEVITSVKSFEVLVPKATIKFLSKLFGPPGPVAQTFFVCNLIFMKISYY